MENSHIILTGAGALNKVLGREVYSSNTQLGGTQIMCNNGKGCGWDTPMPHVHSNTELCCTDHVVYRSYYVWKFSSEKMLTT